jgi:hypothetical protein
VVLSLQGRRIINEWDTGVKGKISLWFKGIIGIAWSVNAVDKGQRKAMFRSLCTAAFGWIGEGVNEINDVVEMVARDAAALQALERETRSAQAHASGAHASTGMMRFP